MNNAVSSENTPPMEWAIWDENKYREENTGAEDKSYYAKKLRIQTEYEYARESAHLRNLSSEIRMVHGDDALISIYTELRNTIHAQFQQYANVETCFWAAPSFPDKPLDMDTQNLIAAYAYAPLEVIS